MATSRCDVVASGPMQAHAVRLHPGDDLVACLQAAAKSAMNRTPRSQSCFVLTAVGSLSFVQLRMANAGHQNDRSDSNSSSSGTIRTWNENMEIVSLVGTFAAESQIHLHVCLSDETGATVGGHLMSGTVFTTLELVLGTLQGVAFDRVHDEQTGYNELVVVETTTTLEEEE